MSNIILIGFMGCGKSSIGRHMSENYQYTLIDTDSYIEKQQKCTISEIFEKNGEEYFRQLETQCLLDLINTSDDKMIIAVGGGLPMREENRELLHKLGKVVYLRATIDTLEKRLKGDTTRPLIQGGELRQKIENLFNLRQDTYEELADLIVDTDRRSYQQITEAIRNLEKGRL